MSGKALRNLFFLANFVIWALIAFAVWSAAKANYNMAFDDPPPTTRIIVTPDLCCQQGPEYVPTPGWEIIRSPTIFDGDYFYPATDPRRWYNHIWLYQYQPTTEPVWE